MRELEKVNETVGMSVTRESFGMSGKVKWSV